MSSRNPSIFFLPISYQFLTIYILNSKRFCNIMICGTCGTTTALRRAWPVAQQRPATSWREKRVRLVKNRGKLRFIHKVESEANPCEGFGNLRKDSCLLAPKESSQIETALTEVRNTRRPIHIPGQVCGSAFWILKSVPRVRKARPDPSTQFILSEVEGLRTSPIIMMEDRLCPDTTPYS
jgi:hypothetical protein